MIDPTLGDEIQVTVIATGFGRKEKEVYDYDTNVVDLFQQYPTVPSKKAVEKPVREEVAVGVDGGNGSGDEDYDPDNLEVPTFLRKAMDR